MYLFYRLEVVLKKQLKILELSMMIGSLTICAFGILTIQKIPNDMNRS